MIGQLTDQLRKRDPERDGVRRALRAAIFIPIAAAASFAVAADNQTPIFTILGSIALLIAADFPGTVGTRALSYCGLAINGALLITLGTLAAPHPWVAVPLCLVVGAAVNVFGLLSEVVAAGQRATLMVFILPVCIRPVAPLGDRIFGWVIALLICVPAALFVFPPRYDSELRRQATRVCAALADRIEGTCSAQEVSAAISALRAGFLNGAARPVAMTAGSRALVRVLSELSWLCDRVDSDTGALLGETTGAATRVLRACAAVRLRLRATRLQTVGDENLESGEVALADMPEPERRVIATYVFLATLQELIVQHLDPTVPEEGQEDPGEQGDLE